MTDLQTDAVVVGGGVFGLSTALELARRGRAVTVIDRFGSGHPATSSTGASRSIRVAYSEPFYVELARSALAGWAALERASGRTILQLTGQVDLGPEPVLDALVESSAAAGATLERRTATELRRLDARVIRPTRRAIPAAGGHRDGGRRHGGTPAGRSRCGRANADA